MQTTIATTTPFISLGFDSASLYLIFNYKILVVILLFIFLVYLVRFLLSRSWLSNFEFDQAELGIGNSKISLKPNFKDKEIAYKIWVELSTRKIGLPIDLKNDVISEIYDSWYNFFSVTRELVKDIPVNKLKHDSTKKIIDLSIAVLNEGLRPHLTLWQARFRHWYDIQLKTPGDIEPQAIQAKYAEFENLSKDLLKVNDRLIRYREKMKELVLGLPPTTKGPELKPTLSN